MKTKTVQTSGRKAGPNTFLTRGEGLNALKTSEPDSWRAYSAKTRFL